ncbi:MAG: aminotransferase class III-fold pyridoxal phosphate-dependent enzyme [Alphaproteobacteria bacterium]|nr:aminotransferase class III-fold pyridoxal phosphate-dependent enzyme [Alphaproteobacteria bacterium]
MADDPLLQRRVCLLGAASPLFYSRPLHLVRGEGVWLYDADGGRYLDAYNNVANVGHCHPHVVEALEKQAKTLNTHTRYLHEAILDYGEALTATFEDPLSMLYMCCTGTEANELALRIAKACSGASGVIVTDFCYHGNSATIAELCTAYPGPEGIGANVRAVTVPDPYRWAPGQGEAEAADQFAAQIDAAIASLAESGMKTAALLVDTVFTTEGLPNMPAGAMQKAVAAVHAAGGFYIADEVQPGFGRTGENMWGYQLYGAAPDLVTMGKPMGNGHPLAGVVSRSDLSEEFGEKAMYFNTFGGNPVAASVGLAVLQVIEREGLMANALKVGKHLRAGFGKLAEKHEIIGDVRGHGLFCGAEFVSDRAAKTPAPEATRAVVDGMRERGVLISGTGRDDNVLKIRPPLPFSTENADFLLQTLDDCLDAM